MSNRVNRYSIVVPVYNNFEVAKECVDRIIKYTPSDVDVLVIDDASTDGNFKNYFNDLPDRVQLSRNDLNLGFVKSVNLGFDFAGINDVILVNSDVFVVARWAERLHIDAHRSDLIATVTALTDNGSIASIRLGDRDLVDSSISEIEDLSEYLDSLTPLPPATIPVGVGHCLYIKRSVINSVGKFSEEFSPGYGEEVDFCMRAVQSGFINTLSNSVIVKHLEGTSFGTGRKELKRRHQQLIEQKYPNYSEYISTSENHSDARKTIFLRVLTRKHGIRVVIDGRRITRAQNGTAIVSFELAKCLSMSEKFHGSVLLLMNDENMNIRNFDSKVKIVTRDELDLEVIKNGKFDVFFTPAQVDDENFFNDARDWVHRTMILQLDFIAFDNPFYHGSIEGFRRYQKLALQAGQKVDRVLYNSDFIATESMRALQSSDLVSAQQAVVGNGIEHIGENQASARSIQGTPQIGIIGTSFHHKNRMFGLEIIRDLQCEFPDARLHLIGMAPSNGGSEELEEAWLTDNENLRKLVINHGGVSETQKSNLMALLDLLLVPSVSEGFGLAPFDGLPSGVPSIFPKIHSTAELLPDPPSYISLEDPQTTFKEIAKLLKDDEARNAQFSYLVKVKETFTWTTTGNQIATAIQEIVLQLPRVPSVINQIEATNTISHEIRNEDLNIRVAYRALGQTRFLLRVIPMHSRRRKIVNRILAPWRFPRI